MSAKFLNGIDLAKTELLNARIQNLGSAPSSPVEGQLYWDSATHTMKVHNGTTWIDPQDRATHSGTQLASTISNFDTAVRTSRLDQMAAPTAAVSANSQRITNLATPTTATDACTRGYVDALVNGLDWKQSVRVVAVANITLSGLQTIDGISVVAGNRVAATAQTTASANGIYIAGTGAWTRASDADAGTLTANAAFFVEEGTSYQDSQWRLTTNDPITVGTTSLAFAQIGAGTSYTAGTGVAIAGNVISVDTAVTVRKYAADIGNGSLTSITVTHGLGTKDVTVSVRQNSDDALVYCDVVATSTTQVTLIFATAPATNALRVVVHG